MRDETEIQEMADKVATVICKASASASTVVLEAIRETLDWVPDESIEDDPVG